MKKFNILNLLAIKKNKSYNNLNEKAKFFCLIKI